MVQHEKKNKKRDKEKEKEKEKEKDKDKDKDKQKEKEKDKEKENLNKTDNINNIKTMKHANDNIFKNIKHVYEKNVSNRFVKCLLCCCPVN